MNRDKEVDFILTDGSYVSWQSSIRSLAAAAFHSCVGRETGNADDLEKETLT